MRIEIGAFVVEQALRIGLDDTIAEAFPDQAALTIAAVRIEAVANDATPVAHDIRHDSDEARRHLRKVDVGVPDRRGDRLGDFNDIDNSHGLFLPCGSDVRPPRSFRLCR
jgi:hypothetical protein